MMNTSSQKKKKKKRTKNVHIYTKINQLIRNIFHSFNGGLPKGDFFIGFRTDTLGKSMMSLILLPDIDILFLTQIWESYSPLPVMC